jgi:glycosyltransferase involved in cell wall biosynthesis
VHTAQFGVHFGRWMATAGRLLEGPAARIAYRRHACVAVSPSTVAAMRDRLGWSGDIYLIPNGAPPTAPPAEHDDEAPSTLTWVGRLVAHKRAELILTVAERARNHGLTIDVIGRGPAEQSLAQAVAAHGLGGTVRLRGFLSESDKQAAVAGSLLHLNTSQGEGWGLCVIEAAAAGVPTVAYDVDGLRDAVRDGQTGWLVRDGEDLADVVDRAVKELADPARRAAVAQACRRWAAQLGWEASTARMAELITAAVEAGTARARRQGTWIVSRATDEVLAEGPVLDALIAAGATPLRPATPLERLTGVTGRR